MSAVGFIGLGNMGRPMANNLARAGHDLIVFDAAGSDERAPAAARTGNSVAEVAAAAEIICLSLPGGPEVLDVTDTLTATTPRAARTVIDLSTTGMAAAAEAHARLHRAGVEFADAPVSGGTAGAAAGTVAVMVAAEPDLFDRLAPLLGAIGRPFHVGREAGQGQAMKLLNNFLSGTAMAATSEAIAFGISQGLEPALMLEVLNASTGRNTATADKFPNRILPGRYDAGFAATLMSKDLGLYLEGVRNAGTSAEVGGCIAEIWGRFLAAEPDADFTRIYPFLSAK